MITDNESALYDDIDDEIVEKLNPEGSGWSQMPETWQKRFRAATQERWKESPSSIVAYIECPMKWMLERYLIEDDSEEVSFHALIGSIVHRILEVFYNEPNKMRHDKRLKAAEKRTWDELLNATRTGIVDARLLDEWLLYLHQQTTGEGMADGFVTRDEAEVVKQMKQEVHRRIIRLKDIDPDPKAIDVIATETWVRTKKNDIAINGKIDRIVHDDETDMEIIQDYKTGRTPFGDPDVDILENAFIPCGLYALMRSTLSEKNFSDAGVVKAVELLYLKESEIYEIEIGEEEVRLADNLLEAVTREMNFTRMTGEIKICPAEESDTQTPCRFCPVSGLCPAFAEEDAEPYDELRDELPYLWEDRDSNQQSQDTQKAG